MNETIMKTLGFHKEVEEVRRGNCPFCKEPILDNGFRDELSVREYRISGLCQKCQDHTFSSSEE